MKEGRKYDLVVKDLFQREHPNLLDQMTGVLPRRTPILQPIQHVLINKKNSCACGGRWYRGEADDGPLPWRTPFSTT
jgi:hypothetical protein